MLPKRTRLPRGSFASVSRFGKSVSDSGAILRVSKGQSGGTSQFGIVVSGKSVSGAAGRNKLKRRGREIIRRFVERVRPGHKAVIFFKKPAGQMSFRELNQTIEKLFEESGLI